MMVIVRMRRALRIRVWVGDIVSVMLLMVLLFMVVEVLVQLLEVESLPGAWAGEGHGGGGGVER
jgi:hypothetical protein